MKNGKWYPANCRGYTYKCFKWKGGKCTGIFAKKRYFKTKIERDAFVVRMNQPHTPKGEKE